MPSNDRILIRLIHLIQDYDRLQIVHNQPSSGTSPIEVTRFITSAMAAIDQIAGRPSAYADQCKEIMQRQNCWDTSKALYLVGVVRALHDDVVAGYLESERELLHGELFGDFLEMAQHLLDEGYKDAAAVIAGSSLEAHQRQLCIKNGIAVDVAGPKGMHAKKADTLNSELAAARVYSKQDQKNVTAWLGLRNNAAHGLYDQYTRDEVGILIAAVRDFITRNPA
jgi:hypothetical protein